MKKIVFVKILMFAISFSVTGQKKVNLFFQQSEHLKSGLSLKDQIIDSAAIEGLISSIYQELYLNGYLAANIELVSEGIDSINVTINEGNEYKIGSLAPGNLPLELQRRIDYHEKFYSKRKFNYQQISRLIGKILDYSDNNGYPFASVKLDSVRRSDDMIFATINYQEGPFITFDSLKIEGEIKTKSSFIQNYLRIFPQKPFEINRIDEAPSKLSRLPFLIMDEDGFLSFQNNQATYHLKLSNRKVNLIDGIIGFLPNETNGNKLLVTGQFDLELHDLFSSGKRLEINWKRLKVESQSLQAKYFHPYLLRSPISFDVGFNLLKEDTTFLNRNINLDLSYDAGKFSTYYVIIHDKTSSTLSDSSPGIVNLDVLDFDLTTYGLGYGWSNLNDFLDPTRGLDFGFNAEFGNKKIRENNAIPIEVYDTIAISSLQYQVDLKVNYFIPVGQKWVFNTRLTAGKIFNDLIFNNDMYRIGGLNSLRGFNENFFFTSAYGLINMNWKFYFEQSSHFLFFLDQGIMQKSNKGKNIMDYPTGIGAGISFNTPSGLFSFIYALGRNNDQPLNFSLSKIHFGYSSRF